MRFHEAAGRVVFAGGPMTLSMFSTLPPSGSGAILRSVDRAAAEHRDAQPAGEEAAAGRRSVMRALLAFASAPGSDGDLESSFRL